MFTSFGVLRHGTFHPTTISPAHPRSALHPTSPEPAKTGSPPVAPTLFPGDASVAARTGYPLLFRCNGSRERRLYRRRLFPISPV